MPDFVFVDREGNDLGLIRVVHDGWAVGDEIERRGRTYRVVEVIEPSLPDIDDAIALLVEPVN